MVLLVIRKKKKIYIESVIYWVRQCRTNEHYGTDVLDRNILQPAAQQVERVQRGGYGLDKYIPDAELKLLSDLGAHKNVSKIFAIVNLRNNLREKFRAAIMPLALFDLSDMINECGKLPADHGNNAFLQVCSGLDHLHKKEIAHGDVKPNNILVYVEDSDLCYKLTVQKMIKKL